MEDFKAVYNNPDDIWPDHLICNHCNEKVERGIANVSKHWLKCEKRTDGLIQTDNEDLKNCLDKMSINFNPNSDE